MIRQRVHALAWAFAHIKEPRVRHIVLIEKTRNITHRLSFLWKQQIRIYPFWTEIKRVADAAASSCAWTQRSSGSNGLPLAPCVALCKVCKRRHNNCRWNDFAGVQLNLPDMVESKLVAAGWLRSLLGASGDFWPRMVSDITLLKTGKSSLVLLRPEKKQKHIHIFNVCFLKLRKWKLGVSDLISTGHPNNLQCTCYEL